MQTLSSIKLQSQECWIFKKRLLVKGLSIAGHETYISFHTLNLAFNIIGWCPQQAILQYLLCTTTWSTLWVSILCYSYFLFVFAAIGIGNFLYISCSYLYWWCWSCLIWFSMQYSVLGQLKCDNLECLDGKYLVTIYVISVFFYWV